MNDNRGYTAIAKLLHWLVALLIVLAFGLALVMTDIPGITPTKLKYFNWHKWLGVTVFGLACLRLIWRLFNEPPALPAHMKPWEKLVAHGGHLALYFFIFAVPFVGYLYSLAAGFPVVYLGVLPLPVIIGPDPALKPVLKEAHELIAWAMAFVVAGHAAAALKHHFIDRDDVLRRMLPGGNR
ncbi:cytochrome b [Derxia gummosa]|uniref:Cytochrome b n=1 Tax=Derxia gummosa DSM 723 TaxID=1121388 RepID=A0A8B6X7D7_9BURK|nr:cytochrome b [Derxia gummosa]